jgi:SAM-dependent methyltransferase
MPSMASPSLPLTLTTCPACGANDDARVASAEEIREEVEMLWAFHGRRLRPDTPAEHLADRVAFSQAPPLNVVRCRRCGLVYRNPRERAEALVSLYANEAPEPSVLERLFETQRASYAAQARRLTRIAGRAGTGLEVGSYVGGFLAAAGDRGWRFDGLDVNEHVNAFARAKGLRVTTGDLASDAGGRHFDAIAIWNCFDQLPDPGLAVRQARERLREGGILAIRVPNGAFYARVRRMLHGVAAPIARALLAHNNLLTFPYRHGFSPASLSRLLQAGGFATVRARGDTLVPIADEWTHRWAAIEERWLKRAMRAVARDAGAAPWFELYARASAAP